ncbi:MAG: hypothetical protein AB7S56_07795 [Halothiobacillaceae bacterium]
MDYGDDLCAAHLENHIHGLTNDYNSWVAYSKKQDVIIAELKEYIQKLEQELVNWKAYGKGKANDLGIAIADAATGNMEAVALRRYLRTVRETLEAKLSPEELKKVKDMLSIRNPEFAKALYANLKDREKERTAYTSINTKNILQNPQVFDGYKKGQKNYLDAGRPMVPIYDEEKAQKDHEPSADFVADNAFIEISNQSALISK